MSTHEYNKTLKPANGLLVIDPATSRALPPEGAHVQGNAEYWTRRLTEGDVELSDASPAPVDTEVTES